MNIRKPLNHDNLEFKYDVLCAQKCEVYDPFKTFYSKTH